MSSTRHPQRLRLCAALGASVVALVWGCSSAEPASEPVLLDGLFDEWSAAATILDDPPDAPDAEVDILSVQGLDDPAWLYLALDVGNEVSLQALPGTVSLLFDVDGDRGTGWEVNDMAGVDLVVDLSQTRRPLYEGRGAGFAVATLDHFGTRREMERYGLGLMAAPTWSAPRFELRLSRLPTTGFSGMGDHLRLKVVYAEHATVLDETAVGTYSFRTRPERLDPPARVRIPSPSSGAIRVAQWNVASTALRSRGTGMARMLAAVEPDVILLDEVLGSTSRDSIAAFFDRGPLSGLGPWAFVLGETGGRQRALVAARGRTIRPTTSMTGLPYGEGSVSRVTAGDIDSEAVATLQAAGISAAAAWVDVGAAEALFVAVDLTAGGWAGSAEDRIRTLEASTIRDHVAREIDGATGRSPVVIGGDMNMVGSRRPLFALVDALDGDGSDLVPADAQRLGERTYATWRNPRNPFYPGRLDFVLIPDALVSVVDAFVFTTEDLDEETLTELGLERGLAASLSDHLMVVTDLEFGRTPETTGVR